MNWLLSKGGVILAAIAGALAFVVGIFLSGKRAGRVQEKVKSAEAALKQWKKADDTVKKADIARDNAARDARDGKLHDDDGFKRPGP